MRRSVEITISGCDPLSQRWVKGAKIEALIARIGEHETPKLAAIRCVGQRCFDPRNPRMRYGVAPDASVRGDGWCRANIIRNGHVEATVMLRWRSIDENEVSS